MCICLPTASDAGDCIRCRHLQGPTFCSTGATVARFPDESEWVAEVTVHYIGTDSMGATEAIAPTAKKLWGDAPKSPPEEFVIFWNSKIGQFLHVGVWFNPFAIKLNKLANILCTM